MPGLIKNPKDVDDWIKIGNEYLRRKNISKASDAFGIAVTMDPQSTNAWFDFGLVLELQDKLQEALYCYEWVGALGDNEATEKAKIIRHQGVTPTDPTLAIEQKWSEQENGKKKLAREEETTPLNSFDGEQIEKLKELMRASHRLKINQVASYLNLTSEDVFPKLIRCAEAFGFVVDLDEVIFNESPSRLWKKYLAKIQPRIQFLVGIVLFTLGLVTYFVSPTPSPSYMLGPIPYPVIYILLWALGLEFLIWGAILFISSIDISKFTRTNLDPRKN